MDTRVEKQNEPFVTVLMPVYNAAKYLAEAIQSILDQTFTDFELLIVNDGSTDESVDIISRFNDPRIRLVHNDPNMGLGNTLNRGVELSRGKYIAHMHGDDIARPDRIEKQVTLLEENPEIGICGGQIIRMIGDARYPFHYPCGHDDIWVLSMFYAPFAHPTVMVRRQVHLDHDLKYKNEFNSVEDYELWTRFVYHTRAANVDSVLLDYRCHDDQISVTKFKSLMTLKVEIQKGLLQRLVPDISEEDLHTHFRVSRQHDDFSLNDLDQTEAWLLKLLDVNRQARIYDEAAMLRIFYERWQSACAHGAFQGLRVMKKFVQSPLTRLSLYDMGTVKLFAKCLLKKKYT